LTFLILDAHRPLEATLLPSDMARTISPNTKAPVLKIR